MKKLLIIADMEGCVGVYDMFNYEYTKNCMINDVKTVLNHLLAKNEYSLTVVDCHNDGHNLLEIWDEYKAVKFVAHIWMLDQISTYDKAILLGFHAKNNTDGILSHTFRPDIEALFLGAKEIGEVEFLINWLSYYKVKVIGIIGDISITEEIKNIDVKLFPTKNKAEVIVPDKDDIYKKLIRFVDEILNRDNIPLYQYDNSQIILKLVYKNLLINLPDNINKYGDDSIVFEDTIKLINELVPLSKLLNEAIKKQCIEIHKLTRFIRENFNKEALNLIDNIKVKELLHYRDPISLTSDEISILYQELNYYI